MTRTIRLSKPSAGICSAVVHAGRREVLWQDVNNLQIYVETAFSIVLNRCDLTMGQDRFAQSLMDAGIRWEFAGESAKLEEKKTDDQAS